MPYDIVMKDGKHCVVKKDDGKVMGCHDSEQDAKDQMAAIHANEGKAAAYWEPIVSRFLAEHPDGFDRDSVARFCPSCAEKMAARGITRLKPREVRQSDEWFAAMCSKWPGSGGFSHADCTNDMAGKVKTPEAFCAWLEHECTGYWPAENVGESAPAPEAERRACDAELRFVAPPEGKAGVGTLSGYAAVFGAFSLEMGTSRRFRERIAPGAFRGALEGGGNILAFYHHGAPEGGPAMPLGSTRDGSLRLREDGHGLAFDLELPDTTVARDLAELVRRGTVRGVSFSFPTRAARDTWQNEGGTLVRTLHEVRTLLDVSPTHLPAYPDTALAVRSLEAWEGRTINAAGEVSFEQRQRALEAALRRVLGDPWAPGAEYWTVRATFDGSVVVERQGKLLSYPVAWKAGEPALGDPVPVQEVIQPVRSQDEVRRRRRLSLAGAEADLTEGDEVA